MKSAAKGLTDEQARQVDAAIGEYLGESAASPRVWSRVTWYWIGVGLGTCLGVLLGYMLTIGGVL